MATGYQTSLISDLSEDIATVLGYVYNRVDWHKMKSHNAHDVFVHRLQTALARPTFPEFLDKLCNGLSIQAIPYDSLLGIERVCEKDKEAMTLLRKESRVMALLAIKKAKEVKK